MAEILFNVDKVTVSLTGKLIFSGLSWEVQNQQRVGLVGPNGAGKSTLLKLVARELEPDVGNIFRKSGLSWGRLAQEPALPPGKTTLEEAMTAVPGIAAIHHKLAELEQQMGTPAVYEDGDRLAKVMNQHEKWLHQLEQLDGASYESRVKETLVQLGFGQDQWETYTEHLSGGQKKLVMLAKLLVQAPDLLLLDEPDNHLDLAAKQRLEKVIRGYSGCVVIISHDRYLLDEVATGNAELENGRRTL